MKLTLLITKIVGPVLLLRALSIAIDPGHFTTMLRGLGQEVSTISFSFFPIALVMGCIAIATVHSDFSCLAGILIRVMALGGILKGSALIVFPDLVAAKVQILGQAGILNLVLVVCFAVGGYFTWFGYFSSHLDDDPNVRAE